MRFEYAELGLYIKLEVGQRVYLMPDGVRYVVRLPLKNTKVWNDQAIHMAMEPGGRACSLHNPDYAARDILTELPTKTELMEEDGNTILSILSWVLGSDRKLNWVQKKTGLTAEYLMHLGNVVDCMRQNADDWEGED